jgi:hypothetical protein
VTTLTLGPSPDTALKDLAEDHAAAWVPDVLRGVDFLERAANPSAGERVPISVLSVPRPAGDSMHVPVIGLERELDLYRACESLRTKSERDLRAEVCGYRTGASSSPSYAEEFQRFSDFVESGVRQYPWAGSTDVRAFFRSVSYDAVAEALGPTASPFVLQTLRSLHTELEHLSLSGLPAGYSDARLLGNLVLASADASITHPFTRWVDDYRVFGLEERAVLEALAEIEMALHDRGLTVNRSKIRVLHGEEARSELLGRSLASVYHPELEGVARSRAALRSVFLMAIQDPIKDRRAIRFCLPRLAAIDDDVAVPYAIHGLIQTPWEAPRLVQYLARFRHRADVRDSLADALRRASVAEDDWLIGRLSPALAGTNLDSSTSAALARYAETTNNAAVWGHAVRLLVLGRCSGALDLVSRALDPRAALACFADNGTRPPPALVDACPVTAGLLEIQPAPLPSVATLL